MFPLLLLAASGSALPAQQTAKSFANLSTSEPSCPKKGASAAHVGPLNQPLADPDKEMTYSKDQRRSVVDFGVYDVEGKLTKVADLKGRLVVIGIWSTQCYPSQLELQELQGFQTQAAEKHYPVSVLPVHIETWPEVLSYLRRKSNKVEGVQVWRAGLGANGLNIFAPELSALPTTYIIDREGRLAASWAGYYPGRLLTHINRLLNEH
ncbi:MAG TPA: TlpA disulfide reductase family protein [Holophagaceae bacterium]|nr:TlpA disulfide reductase family protein [Holophagaceae bacterium]